MAVSDDDISLLVIPCGLMIVTGSRVTADARKGTLELFQRLTEEPGNFKLKWTELGASAAEWNFDFAGRDLEFKHLARVKGRVYCCFFKPTSQKFLFWMQDPDPETDIVYFSTFNELLTSSLEDDEPEPSPASTPAVQSPAGSLQAAISQAFASALPSASRQNSGLQSALASAMASGLQSLGERGATSQQQHGVDPRLGPTMAQLLDPSHVIALCTDEKFVARMLPLLPEGLRTQEELEFTLSSPQFQEAIGQFDMALRTGSLRTVFAQLGLKVEDASGTTVLKILISALLAQAARQRSA